VKFQLSNIQEIKKVVSTKKTALIYCENQFGRVDGKTAAGLIRQSEIYTIVGVLDSSLAGKDAGEALGDKKNHIPIFANLQTALEKLRDVPNCYIYGKAPLEAFIPPSSCIYWANFPSKYTRYCLFRNRLCLRKNDHCGGS